VAQSS